MPSSILERLRGDLSEYKPLIVWLWNGDIGKNTISAQISEIKRSGFGGFIIKPSDGLKIAYLGEEWFSLTAFAISEASKARMKVLIDDSITSYRSFIAAGLKTDPGSFAHYLKCYHSEAFDPKALGCYRVEDGELIHLTGDDGGACECVYDISDDTAPDLINWKVVRTFISEIHDKYYKRCARDFGVTLDGFVSHEPMLSEFGIVYSPALTGKYRNKYSSELIEEIGALFLPCKNSSEIKRRYFGTINELCAEAYAGQLYRWCNEHNCKQMFIAELENGLFNSMRLSAGVMSNYEYAHIPGVSVGDKDASLTARAAFSSAIQLGKKQAACETIVLPNVDKTPKALKRTLETSFSCGAFKAIIHSFSYTDAGSIKGIESAVNRIRDPWVDSFCNANAYFTRLSYLLSNSKEIADTLIIPPLSDGYESFDILDPESVSIVENNFETMLSSLKTKGILFHVADENVLKKYGGIKGAKLAVGKQMYSYVIAPNSIKDAATCDMLNEFEKVGGKVRRIDYADVNDALIIHSAAYEAENPGFYLKNDSDRISYTVRRSDFGDFIYFANTSKDANKSNVFHINAGGARKFELSKPGFSPIYFEKAEKGIDIPFELEAGESLVIFLSSMASSAEKAEKRAAKAVEKPEAIIESIDDNAYPIYLAELSYDGKEFSEPMRIDKISHTLLAEATNRTVYLKYAFDVTAKPSKLYIETLYGNGAALSLNGVNIENDDNSAPDSLRRYNVAPYIRIGGNLLIVRLDYYQNEETYSLLKGDARNKRRLTCVNRLSEVWPIILKGDFCLNRIKAGASEGGLYSVTLPRKYVNLASLASEGYPFFGGKMSARTIIDADGNEKRLRLIGSYCEAKISMNGKNERSLLFENITDTESELIKGSNDVRITLSASKENMYNISYSDTETDFGIERIELE